MIGHDTSAAGGGRRDRAFTLVETLAVLALSASLMMSAILALNGIKSSGDVARAAFSVAGLLGQARSYAMARGTYVFVGFAERDAADETKPGKGRLLVALMESRDGTSRLGEGTANLVPLIQLQRLGSVRLEDGLPNEGASSRPEIGEERRVANASFDSADSFSTSGFHFTKIIRFDPRGSASAESGDLLDLQRIEVGLVPAQGKGETARRNFAAVVLDGVTGSAKVYRP